jgi:hypothetical protein
MFDYLRPCESEVIELQHLENQLSRSTAVTEGSRVRAESARYLAESARQLSHTVLKKLRVQPLPAN